MKTRRDLKGKKVAVMGTARSGAAASNLLVALGADVTATDVRKREDLIEHLDRLDPAVKLELGGHREETFIRSDMIVVSPGVPWDHPLLRRAREEGAEVIGELELAYGCIDAPIVAITGSNGKSTTTTLTGEILRSGGKKVLVGGNLGTPLAEMVSASEKPEIVVVEVSSFQLETVVTFKPHVAIILNVTPDHLDRHRSLQNYLNLKKRISRNQDQRDWLILKGDDPLLVTMTREGSCRKLLFSLSRPDGDGVFRLGDEIILKMGPEEKPLCRVDDVKLKGLHNLENVMAALSAGAILGLEPKIMADAVRAFRGLEHRMEPAGEINGVKFYNDSKATNVGAALRSVESLSEPIVLILGGRDKGSDFSPLRGALKERVRHAVLMGEAAPKIREAFNGMENVSMVNRLEEAIREARARARRGDVVLLAPACASFDQFKNFEERGKVFKDLVSKLKGRD